MGKFVNSTGVVNYKALTYAFMSLPYVKRYKIIQDLSLGREEDEGLKHVQILDKIIQRAESQKCIDELCNLVQGQDKEETNV